MEIANAVLVGVTELIPSTLGEWVLAATGGIALGCSLLYVKHKMLEKRLVKKTNGMPFLYTNIPFLGNMGNVFTRSYAFYSEIHKEYEEIVGTVVLGKLHVIIFTPELASQTHGGITKDVYQHFDVNWPAPFMRLLGYDNMSMWKGRKHAKARAAVLRYSGHKSMNKFLPTAGKIFEKHVTNALPLFENGNKYVDCRPILETAVWEFMLSVFVGADFFDSAEGKRYTDCIRDIGKGMMSLPVNLPGSTYAQGVASRKVMGEIMMKEARRRMDMDEKTRSERADYFQFCVDEDLKAGGDGVTTLHYDNIVSVIFASVDTTKSASLRIPQALSSFPEVTARIRAEVKMCLGEDPLKGIGNLTMERVKEEMPYVWATQMEIMRYYAISVNTFREVEGIDVQVKLRDGKVLTIPSGSTLITAVHHITRENPHFKNPEKFEPERFLEPRNEHKTEKNDVQRMPFGGGHRKCPGYPVAESELVLFVILLCCPYKDSATGKLTYHDFKLRDKPEDIAFEAEPVVVPVNGLYVTATPVPAS